MCKEDIGYEWMLRQTSTKETAKAVRITQNGLCAYCDIITAAPDGDGVGTCYYDYMTSVNKLSERAKICRIKKHANIELGIYIFDRILYIDNSICVCLACAKTHDNINGHGGVGFSHSTLPHVPSVFDNANMF